MGSSDEIIDLAQRSGIPYRVGSTFRPGATTRSGTRSWHATDDAVDFTGESQDRLAQFFMSVPTLEVIHHSNRTGRNYASSNGQPFELSGALLEDHRDHLHVAANEATARQTLAGNLSAAIAGARAGFKTVTGLSFPTPGNVTEALTNVGEGIQNLATAGAEIAGLTTQIGKLFLPSNLIRGFALFFGTIAILIGVLFLAREVRQSAP